MVVRLHFKGRADSTLSLRIISAGLQISLIAGAGPPSFLPHSSAKFRSSQTRP